jgi:hypothetical protein
MRVIETKACRPGAKYDTASTMCGDERVFVLYGVKNDPVHAKSVLNLRIALTSRSNPNTTTLPTFL